MGERVMNDRSLAGWNRIIERSAAMVNNTPTEEQRLSAALDRAHVRIVELEEQVEELEGQLHRIRTGGAE